MVEKIEGNVPGHKTWEISTFKTFKNTMIQLLMGYPLHEYYGIWETYFRDKAPIVLRVLENDGLLEVLRERGKQDRYRLSSKGVDYAVSMINLKHSERVLEYSRRMDEYTRVIKILTGGMFAMTTITLLFLILTM